MYGFETQLVDTIVRFLLGLLGLILLEAAAGVFLGLCVYNDACYRGDSNPVLWGVLSGFFNIVALVYIIVQLSSKNKTAFCVQCRAPIPQGYTVCPACGMPLFLRGKPVSAEQMEAVSHPVHRLFRRGPHFGRLGDSGLYHQYLSNGDLLRQLLGNRPIILRTYENPLQAPKRLEGVRFAYTNRFCRVPMPWMSASTTSPGRSQCCSSGGRPCMTPPGVPVNRMSPGSRVM